MQMFFKMMGRLQRGDCVLLRDMPSCYHCVDNILCLSSSFKFFITCILLLGVITALLEITPLPCLLRDLMQYLLDL